MNRRLLLIYLGCTWLLKLLVDQMLVKTCRNLLLQLRRILVLHLLDMCWNRLVLQQLRHEVLMSRALLLQIQLLCDLWRHLLKRHLKVITLKQK